MSVTPIVELVVGQGKTSVSHAYKAQLLTQQLIVVFQVSAKMESFCKETSALIVMIYVRLAVL